VTASIEVVLVANPGCHYCDDARRILDEIGEEMPLRVRTVPLSSAEGRVLVVRHRVPFPPILVVNGRFFGYGRISRRKLERHLAETTSALQV
jgi:glutaredoxin